MTKQEHARAVQSHRKQQYKKLKAKFIKKTLPNVQETPDFIANIFSSSSNNTTDTTAAKPTTKFHKELKQRTLEQAKREQIQRERKEREEALQRKEKERKLKSKKLLKRSKSGQPIMANMLEHLIEKIKKDGN